MISTPASVSSARKVMSPRLPIGVATRCRPGAALGAVMVTSPSEKVRAGVSGCPSGFWLSGLFMGAGFARIILI
ncbi:MAG: hypothetical protein WDN50_23125 [Bradyrhizobium sp.]